MLKYKYKHPVLHTELTLGITQFFLTLWTMKVKSGHERVYYGRQGLLASPGLMLTFPDFRPTTLSSGSHYLLKSPLSLGGLP